MIELLADSLLQLHATCATLDERYCELAKLVSGIAISPLIYHNCIPGPSAPYYESYNFFMGRPLVVVSQFHGALIIIFTDEDVWKRFLQHTDQ